MTAPAPAVDWNRTLPLIAILRGIRPEEVVEHVDALVEAGFTAIEVPLNSPAWPKSIEAILARFGSQTLIGGGTVLRNDEVDTLAGLGAKLIVTPNTRPSLIAYAVARGLYVAPGFATASEAFYAIEAGAQALKLFPATTYGPGHVRALRAVLPPALPLFAVGGITPANLAEYLAAGCTGAGLGSDLYRPGQRAEDTAIRARDFAAAYQGHREGHRARPVAAS
jgi:2-dehydro-3-deoxyphosphogalactonate aldolase